MKLTIQDKNIEFAQSGNKLLLNNQEVDYDLLKLDGGFMVRIKDRNYRVYLEEREGEYVVKINGKRVKAVVQSKEEVI